MLSEFKYQPLRFSELNSEIDKGILQNEVDCIMQHVNNLNAVSRDFIRIGYHLKTIREGKLYFNCYRFKSSAVYFYGDAFLNDPFAEFCYNHFNLGIKKVNRLISFCEKFSNDGIVKDEFKDYCFSQLDEMVSMDDELLSKCKPSMTVKDLRKLKKGEPDKSSNVSVVPSDVPEEKPTIDKYVFKDMVDKKSYFKLYCRRFFDLNNVKVISSGKHYGGTAFGDLLFDYLEKRGFFNNPDYVEKDEINGLFVSNLS